MQFLRSGSSGPDVTRIQKALNGRMLPPINPFTRPALDRLVEDGIFGPKTQAMVKEFQRLNEIQIDGIVGQDTSYLLFPYLTFSAGMRGQGRVIGKQGLSASPQPARRLSANPPLLASPVQTGGAKAKGPPSGGGKAEEEDGFTLNLEISQGIKHDFKPWFVLKPDEEPEGSRANAVVSIEATVLRLKGFEFGGELEFTRPAFAPDGATWRWEGAVKGSYKPPSLELGGFLSISPVAELAVKQGLNLGVGIGAEITVKHPRSDILQLTVGGKITTELDMKAGNLKVGPEVSPGMFNLTLGGRF